MDVNEKRKELLRQRRHEISEEYKRRREKENKPLVLDTEEVTISIENLQAHLQSLSREITIEKLNRRVDEYRDFFSRLKKDQQILFELIENYKKNQQIPDRQPSEPVETLILEHLQHRRSGSLPHKDVEVNLTTQVSDHTYSQFKTMVERIDLSEKDCVELALRLFVEYCQKNIPTHEDSPTGKSKIFRNF